MQDNASVDLVLTSGKVVWSSLFGAVATQRLRLFPGESLTGGQVLSSPNGLFQAAMTANGQFAVSKGTSMLWTTPATKDPGTSVKFRADGSFEVLDKSGAVVWSSTTGGTTGDHVQLSNRGALEVFGPSGMLWSSTSGPVAHSAQSIDVALFGDSLSAQAEQYFTADLAEYSAPVIYSTADAFPGTAPCDWTSEMQSVASGLHPNVAILEFVGNTFTSCITGAGASGVATTVAQYQVDMLAAIKLFLDHGSSHVIVIADPSLMPGQTLIPAWSQVRRGLGQTVSDLGDSRVSFYNAGSWVDDPTTGGFTFFRVCTPLETFAHDCDGPVINGVENNIVRAVDGIHFCNPSGFVTCDQYSSGAWRFGGAEAYAAEQAYKLAPVPQGPPTH